MGESGLLAAVAQWVSTVGIPSMALLWYRQVQWNHRQDLAIAALESRLADYVTLRQDLNSMNNTVTEIRVIVGQMKERMDSDRRRQSS